MKLIVNSKRRPVGRFCVNTKVSIGDVVSVTSFNGRYPRYKGAFKYFWGSESDGLNNELMMALNVDITNQWKVVNINLHGDYLNEVIVHLRNRVGINIVVDEEYLEIIRPSKHENITIERERITI